MTRYFHYAALAFACFCLVYRAYAFFPGFTTYWTGDDFNHYYATAAIMLDGKVPYGIPFQSLNLDPRFEWHPLAPSGANQPFMALLLVPLALFPPFVAWCIWTGFNLCCAIAAFFLVLSWLCPKATRSESAGLFVFFLSTMCLWLILDLGQIQPVVMLAAIFGWKALREGRDGDAGIWLGIAASLKFYPYGLLVWLLMRRNWRGVWFGGITCALCMMLPILFYGVEMWRSYLTAGLSIVESSTYYLDQNYSISEALKMLVRAVGDVDPSQGAGRLLCGYVLPALIMGLVMLFAISHRSKGEAEKVSWLVRRDEIDRQAALVMPLTFLSLPVAWDNYLIVFFVCFLFVYGRAKLDSRALVLLFLAWAVVYQMPNAVSRLSIAGYEMPWFRRVLVWAVLAGLLSWVAALRGREAGPVAGSEA